MDFLFIKNNRDNFKTNDNFYKCPICNKLKSIKGFIQHVRNHFYERDLTNFNNSAKENCKNIHLKAIEEYNSNPNKCLYCGNDILATENDKIRFVKTKKFCCKSCAAKYNNAHRDSSVYQKVKETWKNKGCGSLLKPINVVKIIKRSFIEKRCKFCDNIFSTKNNSQVFCSSECREKSYGTKEELIKWVDDFVAENGYVPTSKMNRRMNRLARQNYGSWNKAIKELGYEPHSQKYHKGNYVCKDGHIADSISEMLVDDWLYKNNIKHERRRKYPDSLKDCDFYLNDLDVWVEYFGLANEGDNYDEIMKEKIDIANKNDLKLIQIFHSDLYPKNNLRFLIGDTLFNA